MRNRGGIPAILFFVRLTIAFQFQSVAAVVPLLEKTFGLGLADIGILIGLYFTPGVVVALPAGPIGRERRGRARPGRAGRAGLPAADVAFRMDCVCPQSSREIITQH